MAESTFNHDYLKRLVSMLTRLIQHTETVSEGRIEYEYRDAEYEYETTPRKLTNKELQTERANQRFGNGYSIAPTR